MQADTLFATALTLVATATVATAAAAPVDDDLQPVRVARDYLR